MSEATKRLRIHGRVQGVFYRAWSCEAARALGLRGWVRNRRDGSVEMLVRGEREAVGRLIEQCRSGPPSARVERIDIEDAREQVPDRFEKRPTV
ncbi:MAG TPA: acylphosphatase [Allosphingosinicella sp.]|nr:acylphosphatase [Allosphingosinicella sp.]